MPSLILITINCYWHSCRMLLARSLTYFCTGIEKYGISSRIGGCSSEGLYEIYAHNYKNEAMQKYKMKNSKTYGVTVLTTPDQCRQCLKILEKVSNIVAWDTQTIDLDIKNQSPVGKGKIICASFFAGPEFDFGNGPKVFIDNFGTSAGNLEYFKAYLENSRHKKVWHNYGFDRHVFYNHGINVQGLGGDTMHMARLYDPAKNFGEYSLASLTKEYRQGIDKIVKIYLTNKQKQFLHKLEDYSNKIPEQSEDYRFCEQALMNLEKYKTLYQQSSKLKKIKMDQLFMRKKVLKSGQAGKTYEFPTTITLHTAEQHIPKWVQYSVLDAESTFFLREALELALKNQQSKQHESISNIWEVYQRYWLPFGELLTDMERQGFKINIDYMKKIEAQAMATAEEKKSNFMKFLYSFQNDPNIDYFNPSSNLQMQQLLHAPFKVDPELEQKNAKQSKKEIDAELSELQQSSEEQVVIRKVAQREVITQLEEVKIFKVDNQDAARGNRKINMAIKGLGIPAARVTPTGLPSVDEESLKLLAGSPKNGKYGQAYEHFKKTGNQQFGRKVCEGLQTLIQYRNIETLLQTFIQPLQTHTDKNNRIHCSLNINTETGRLSSKKPNLQNQPALEKDIYKIRSAFTVEKGNKLIVADYGQLELRVLAHLTNCKSMITAFKAGGDFHSRTAIGMFDYIKKDIEEGKVILEWDKSKGEAPAPLLKQKYASERKKAKTVNFSIAYGKTAQGFAEDWNCTVDEAKAVIRSWFKDRPEVEEWQRHKQNIAKTKMITQTLLGRYRRLDKFFVGTGSRGSHYGMGLRRAINTPIQGGAADIVIAAMVKIHQNEELKRLGWKLLLQIHDELILQGPQENANRAYEIVKQNMMHPFDKDLLIELEVDAKLGTTWYECK